MLEEETQLIASFDIGIKNLALCIIDKQENIHHWEVLDISGSTNHVICKRMVTQLDEIKLLENIKTILIEKQPSFNPKMRIVQGYVETYFLIRSLDKNINPKIVNYSAKHKLKCHVCEIPEKITKLKSEYSQRKKISILHTQEIIKIKQTEEIISLFVASKKKDDLADSFLQALSYIRYNEEKSSMVIGKVTLRKPSSKQLKYKRFSRSNLKFLLIEDIKKCLFETREKNITDFTETRKSYSIDEFLKEWIENSEGIKKNILSIYDPEYEINTVKMDLVPEIYIDKAYTLEFSQKPKKRNKKTIKIV
jgi:hypothetical protein